MNQNFPTPNHSQGDIATQIAELRRLKATRDEEIKSRREALELEALQVEHKFATERNWTPNVDFTVIITDVAVFAVQKPDFVVMKKYNSIPEDKKSDEDIQQLADVCLLHPTKDAARNVFAAHGGTAWRCVAAIQMLYAARASGLEGKF